MIRLTITVMLWCLVSIQVFSQNNNPYFLNGNATQDNCNCYTLTSDAFTQAGSVWNINKISLNNPFTYSFNVNLGCRDEDGADGIVFMLQPISTSVGSSGGGLGFQGVSPSVGVTIDTWQNNSGSESFGDPTYDHIAIQLNGDNSHNSTNNIAGPVQALANSPNIEDCNWHVLKVEWNPTTKILKASLDGVERVSATIDLVATVFNNDPMVFWGFSASTGGARNAQKFCTSLNPGFSLNGNETSYCWPAPVTFSDSSTSFGSIIRWHWDFGDGSTSTLQNPPVKNYAQPGIYNVKLVIEGNNGCVSDTFRRQIIQGSEPVADFDIRSTLNCDNIPIQFEDQSRVQVGTINRYEWKVDGVTVETLNTPGWSRVLNSGNRQVSLTVSTREGCISDEYILNIPVAPSPRIGASANDACVDEDVLFTAGTISTAPAVRQFYWLINGTDRDSGQQVTRTFALAGQYPYRLTAIGSNGCPADTVSQILRIVGTRAFAGNDTVAAMGIPIQLNGSGGDRYQWTPPTGLSDPNIANPTATLDEDITYVLTAFSDIGCESTDTIRIRVFKGPEIYVPNVFTPNGDNRNDRLRFVAVGMQEIRAFRIFNRFGQLIYSNVNPTVGWDGSWNGKEQPLGTYVWFIDAIDLFGKSFRRKGTVTLIR